MKFKNEKPTPAPPPLPRHTCTDCGSRALSKMGIIVAIGTAPGQLEEEVIGYHVRCGRCGYSFAVADGQAWRPKFYDDGMTEEMKNEIKKRMDQTLGNARSSGFRPPPESP